MDKARAKLAEELKNDGYKLFMQTVVGSVVNAEAWVSRPTRRPMVIVLYRRDTGEAVDPTRIPDDESRLPDVCAFMNDFRKSEFRHRPGAMALAGAGG